MVSQTPGAMAQTQNLAHPPEATPLTTTPLKGSGPQPPASVHSSGRVRWKTRRNVGGKSGLKTLRLPGGPSSEFTVPPVPDVDSDVTRCWLKGLKGRDREVAKKTIRQFADGQGVGAQKSSGAVPHINIVEKDLETLGTIKANSAVVAEMVKYISSGEQSYSHRYECF